MPIMDQDDELARLKAMNADLLKISADLDAIVKESKRLKTQNQELREALQQLFDCSIPTGQDTRTDRAMRKAVASLNQSSGG
jgi:regulator of replication initiation timing